MDFKPVSLFEATYKDLKSDPPNVAILPWGATEAHNYHLPYASDVIEAARISELSAEKAKQAGAKPVVLPPVPFGNNAQHLDQYVTIHLSTATANMILNDVITSLVRQNMDRLIIVNSHGGNNFKPLVRDIEGTYPVLIVLANLYEMVPEIEKQLFDQPGDHAGELETSMMMHLHERPIDLDVAGPGERIPFALSSLRQPGIWTPRPWKQSHPDSGSGNPKNATPEKGRRYVESLCNELSRVIVELSKAKKGDLPYI